MDKRKYIPALGFAFLSKGYDLVISLTMPEKKFRGKLIQLINPIQDEKILEFGFGTGENILLIGKRINPLRLTGVDVDPEIKSIAEKKLKLNGLDVPLLLYDGENFPTELTQFDKVYSCLVFHHLSNDLKSRALIDLYRALKPSGKIIIGDWGKPSNKFMRILFYIVQLFDGFETTQDNVKGLLPQYMREAGFINVSDESYIDTALGTFRYYQGTKA